MAFVTRPALVASDFVNIQNEAKKSEDKKKDEKKKKPVKKVAKKKVVVPKKFVGRALPWK